MEPNELTSFKESFIQCFCESPKIRTLLGAEGDSADLKYRRIFPFLYDAAAAQETGAFLCIDTVVRSTEVKTYKRLEVIVWCYARQQDLKADEGSRCDLLAQEAYQFVNGHTFHARSLKLASMIPFRPAPGYRGNRMIFETTVMD